MIFHNKAGQAMNLASNLTLRELAEMGVELTISEKVDPKHELWMADDLKAQPSEKPREHTH